MGSRKEDKIVEGKTKDGRIVCEEDIRSRQNDKNSLHIDILKKNLKKFYAHSYRIPMVISAWLAKMSQTCCVYLKANFFFF